MVNILYIGLVYPLNELKIKFENIPDYRRFYTTGILTNLHNDVISVDFFEETLPSMKTFFMDEQGKTNVDNGGFSYVNFVHATAIINPAHIPVIINSLQNIYDRYIEEKKVRTGD